MIVKAKPEIERLLARPPAELRAVLLYGADRGVVRERADLLASRVTERPDDPFDTAALTDSDLDGGRLLDELSALSMMGGRRLVRLRLTTDKAGPDATAAEALAEHLAGRLNPDAFFLVEAGALGRSSGLRKAAEAAKAGVAVIPCYEDEAGDVAGFAREALARDGVALTREAMAQFVARLPRERGVARQEIERLALYLGPGSGVTAGPEQLEDFLGVEPEASLADAASDAFGGRLAEAHASLRRAAAEGEHGVAAVAAVSRHANRLRRILLLHAAGAGLQEAAKSSGVFWKQEREVLRQARSWTTAALDEVQADTLDADRACKRAGSPDRLIAERLALSVAGRARRLGL